MFCVLQRVVLFDFIVGIPLILPGLRVRTGKFDGGFCVPEGTCFGARVGDCRESFRVGDGSAYFQGCGQSRDAF